MSSPTEVVYLPAAAAAGLRHRARDSYPREACGFLIGRTDGPRSTVTSLQGAVNRSERDDRYHIVALDVFEARCRARSVGEEVVGVFHSHPDAPASPSNTDALEAWGGWVHLIVSCEAGEDTDMRCWQWDGSAFVPVSLESAAE